MPVRTTHVIALANQKGGCGKTTSAVSLAAGLAHEGFSVCLVDTDPQCNATDTFGVDRDKLAKEGKLTVADVFLQKAPAREIRLDFGERFDGNLTLVAGHRALGAVPHQLEAELRATTAKEGYSELDADDIKDEHRQRLKNSIASLRGVCDAVVVDTPPELGFCMTSSLIAADWYVIPVFPSGYDLRGLETLLKNVAKVQAHYNRTLRLLGVLIGNVDTRAKLDGDVRQMLTRKFGEEAVFETSISRSVKHREATVYYKTIFEHAGGEQAAEQFRSLTREIMTRLAEASKTAAPPVKEVANVQA